MGIIKWLKRHLKRGPKVTVTEVGHTGVVQESQSKAEWPYRKEMTPAQASVVRKGIVTAASVQQVREEINQELKRIHMKAETITVGTIDASKLHGMNREEYLAQFKPLGQRPLGNIRAVRKMKHGHQSPYYRKSVRANVKPEVEEEE
jgi:hypothetical protein